MSLDDIRPVIAIVQARMSSSRLPGKVMKEICGRPMLWYVVSRLSAARLLDKAVIATSEDPSDDVIEKWCRDNGVPVFRGSLDDVLDRYYMAARSCGANTVVRITADCPLIDPVIVDEIVKRFSSGDYDYVAVDHTYPNGLDAEVFSRKALEKAHAEATLSSEREHVTPYIWKNPQIFRHSRLMNSRDLNSMRWTVDDEKDFLLATKICEGLGASNDVFHMEDILAFLARNPELTRINAGTRRNEGYAKSLREDRVVKKIAG